MVRENRLVSYRARIDPATTQALACRSAITWALALLLVWLTIASVAAETIAVRSALVRPTEDALVIDAEFDITLTAPLEAALLRGTPLYFALDTEITRRRAYWFDDSLPSAQSVRRLTYSPLTSSYRVDTGRTLSGSANYPTLEEALRQIRLIRGRSLIDKKELRNGAIYEVSIRLRLDTTQLPKPLQVNTLVSREWSLISDWYRVVVTP
ncbi:MAG: DUF4390 domain-containing protein [Betaproteobacteria bacterium]|nr:MAG: DUF4390 domain-containing protein [Betaproteobacteria bacterium]TAG84541.1 MAG: DUF4390 domain-containing protein [Betaproteobacteria bacterium]